MVFSTTLCTLGSRERGPKPLQYFQALWIAFFYLSYFSLSQDWRWAEQRKNLLGVLTCLCALQQSCNLCFLPLFCIKRGRCVFFLSCLCYKFIWWNHNKWILLDSGMAAFFKKRLHWNVRQVSTNHGRTFTSKIFYYFCYCAAEF